jgi:hypothetical protein
MKKFDYRIDEKKLKQYINQEFKKFRCEKFLFTNSVLEVVGLYINDDLLTLNNEEQLVDYFGILEDVPIFSLRTKSNNQEKIAEIEDNMIDRIVNKRIVSITIVNEHQIMIYKTKPKYDVWITRAIIFKLDDLEEICFEKDSVWFSEEIVVNRGHNLINILDGTNKFIETMEMEEDTTGECYREKIILE